MPNFSCNHCKTLLPDTKTKVFLGQHFCPKCRQLMVQAASERAVLSGRAPTEYEAQTTRRVSARNHHHSSDQDDVVLACKDQLIKDPLNVNALADLVRRYISLSDFGQAKRYCDQLSHLEEGGDLAAILSEQLNSPELKKIWLEKSLKKATSALALEQRPSAKIELETCLKLAPESKEVLQLAASYYQADNQPKTAVSYLKKLIDLTPKDPYLWANMGLLCLEIGNKKIARQALNQLDKCEIGDGLKETVDWLRSELGG